MPGLSRGGYTFTLLVQDVTPPIIYCSTVTAACHRTILFNFCKHDLNKRKWKLSNDVNKCNWSIMMISRYIDGLESKCISSHLYKVKGNSNVLLIWVCFHIDILECLKNTSKTSNVFKLNLLYYQEIRNTIHRIQVRIYFLVLKIESRVSPKKILTSWNCLYIFFWLNIFSLPFFFCTSMP